MLLPLLHLGSRECEVKCTSSVPGRPLVHVMLAQEDSAFPGNEIQCALVEIREVPGHSLGRPKFSIPRLHRQRTSAQRMQAGAGEFSDQRQMAEDGMLDFHGMDFAPLPL